MDRLTSPVASDAPTPVGAAFDPLAFGAGTPGPQGPLAPTATPSDGAEQAAVAPRRTTRPRPRLVTNVNDIPRVPDRVGDRVREGFADFLQTYVALCPATLHCAAACLPG